MVQGCQQGHAYYAAAAASQDWVVLRQFSKTDSTANMAKQAASQTLSHPVRWCSAEHSSKYHSSSSSSRGSGAFMKDAVSILSFDTILQHFLATTLVFACCVLPGTSMGSRDSS